MFKGVNVCVYVGEGLRCSLATPDLFVLINKICLNQTVEYQLWGLRADLSVTCPGNFLFAGVAFHE